MNTHIARLTVIAAAVAGLGLTACSKADRDEAKAKTDQAVAEMKDKAAEVKADVKQGAAEMKADLKQGSSEMKADIKEASADAKAKMGEAKVAVSDASITTSVKAEFAKDDVLKARDINVDTDAGRVSLRGTAPTRDAKERATTLAQAVDGVKSVNNELKVQGS